MKKKIVINSGKDLYKFYDNIKYYRSFLFRFTTFECDNEKVKNIITALNIKNRYKRIEYIYDEACNEIDNFTCGKNMCGFKNGICRTKTLNGCCRKCFHLGKKGCTTKNLTCKLFFCNKVCDKFEIIKMDDIKILYVLSLRNRIILRHDFFSTREEVIKDLWYGSILILFIRYFYRVAKHYFIKKKRANVKVS